MRRRGRSATEDELALWREVNRETVRLRSSAPTPSSAKSASETPEPQAARQPRPFKTARPSGPPIPAEAMFHPKPADIDALGRSTPGLDARTSKALRRGERRPDARIDLHGMTAQQAHGALQRFIIDSRGRGRRCVLVVTGKGGAYRTGDLYADRGSGVLRRDVPRWLREPPLSEAIVGIYRAHQKHGGDGALYVYLRKSR